MGLTAGRDTTELAYGARLLQVPVAASVKIFEGSLVALNAQGYAVPASKAENLTAMGRAEQFADNSAGADGAETVLVKRGAFIWDNDPTSANAVTRALVGKPCYILDDSTVTALATGSSAAGKVLAVTDDGVSVETL